MPVDFRQVELFGGAIKVDVPALYADVSTLREVPDHQEIYLAVNGFSSLIIDLGERVTETTTDEEALLFHFSDVVDEADERSIWSIRKEGVQMPHLPPNTPILTLHATTWPPPPTPTHPRRPNTPTSVTLLMTLIRLEAQTTDMVITLNIPDVPPSSTDAGADAVSQQQQEQQSTATNGTSDHGHGNGPGEKEVSDEDAQAIVAQVWRTLEIRDWGLFGGDGAEAEAVTE